MHRKITSTKPFQKAYKKFVGKNQVLKASIGRTLLKLQEDAYHPSLKTHKLSGKLAIYLSCSCGYDCRVIFLIEKDNDNPNIENIVLVDIGIHDEVY